MTSNTLFGLRCKTCHCGWLAFLRARHLASGAHHLLLDVEYLLRFPIQVSWSSKDGGLWRFYSRYLKTGTLQRWSSSIKHLGLLKLLLCASYWSLELPAPSLGWALCDSLSCSLAFVNLSNIFWKNFCQSWKTEEESACVSHIQLIATRDMLKFNDLIWNTVSRKVVFCPLEGGHKMMIDWTYSSSLQMDPLFRLESHAQISFRCFKIAPFFRL